MSASKSLGQVEPIIYAGAGLIGVILFFAGISFPIWLSTVIIALVCATYIRRFKERRLGVLALLLWVVFALPFIHLPGYILFDFTSDRPVKMWGLAVVPYMFDREIVELTAMLCAVGSIGAALGASLSSSRMKDIHSRGNLQDRRPTLAFPIWLAWVLAGVAFSWISAPADSIFTARYTTSHAVSTEINFSSAWMFSYVLLLYAFSDAIFEGNSAERRLKMRVVSSAIVFIVLFFQLLRGDREAIPWVFAVAMVYFVWAAPYTQKVGFSVPWGRVVAWAAVLAVVSMLIGAVRHLLVGIEGIQGIESALAEATASGRVGLAGVVEGTWSAALLTPLSVAGDYVSGLLRFKYGKDYLDLLLSLPPGFIADAIGYQRPIDAFHGPALEMRYGLGGTHATVLPFRNFGMLGVLVIPAVWSYLAVRFEKFASRRISIRNIALLATVASAAPHWLWYGEKNLINAIVLWWIFWILYRVSLGLRIK